MKKLIEKKFLKKKINLNIMIFEDVNIKNSNARTFIIFYINNTISFASILISKLLFKVKSFLKIKSGVSTKA